MANVPGEKRQRHEKHRSAVMTVVVLIIGLFVGIESFSITYKYMLEDETVQESSSEDSFSANALMEWFQTNSVNTEIDGMIKSVDAANGKITILSMKNTTSIDLTVDDSTELKTAAADGTESKLTLDDFKTGDFVVFMYNKNKTATSIVPCMAVSEDAESGYWEYTNTGCTIVEKSKVINFFGSNSDNDKSYTYDKSNLVVLYGDRILGISDVSSLDLITVRGYTSGSKKKVYAIIVDKGHGQLVMQNYSSIVEGKLHVESIADTADASDAEGEVQSADSVDDYSYSADFDIADTYSYDLVEGKYSVKITSKNFADYDTVVDITPAVPAAIDLSRLEAKKGKLAVSVNVDNASIYVDDKPVEENAQVELEYGQHKVTVTKTGYTTYSETVDLYESVMSVAVDLVVKPKLGTIRVYVSPSNAAVYVDGKKVGTGSLKTDVKIGTHSVTAKADGYTTGGETVTVEKEGETAECSIILEKEKIRSSSSSGTSSSSNSSSASDNTQQAAPAEQPAPVQEQPAVPETAAPETAAPEQPEVIERDPVEDILIDENSSEGGGQ